MSINKLCLVDNPDLYQKGEFFRLESIYRPLPKFLRAIRYITNNLRSPNFIKKIWLGKWKTEVENYTQIIIFDTLFDTFPLQFIRKSNPSCNIHFCYRNKINTDNQKYKRYFSPSQLRQKFDVKVYSYNHDDCNLYGINYYPQFHIIPSDLLNKKYALSYDIFFWGADKGRLPIIEEFESMIKDYGLECKIGVVPDAHTPKHIKSSLFRQNIDYTTMIRDSLKSRCILDLVTDTNRGITYRVIESIILRRKLITNYREIKNTEFYDSENMFIIGLDDFNHLREFIFTPYIKHLNIKITSFSEFCLNIYNQSR